MNISLCLLFMSLVLALCRWWLWRQTVDEVGDGYLSLGDAGSTAAARHERLQGRQKALESKTDLTNFCPGSRVGIKQVSNHVSKNSQLQAPSRVNGAQNWP